MDTSAFLKELAVVLDVDVSKLQNDSVLRDCNWNSLAMVSCIALIDEHFDVLVNGKSLAACVTVGDLLNLIQQRKG